MTQEQTAHSLGIPRELVSMWENENRIPSRYQVEELAKLYKVEKEYLLGQVDLNEQYERTILYRGLQDHSAIKPVFEGWLDFLDKWASFLEQTGYRHLGPGRPPRSLDEGQVITDARRASTLAITVRQHFKLGLDKMPNLYTFLDEQGILVYRAPLGSISGDDGVSGAFYNHPKLGYCIIVNCDTAPGRQIFTLAHEFAHAYYHYQLQGIVSSKDECKRSEEVFADAFSAHFLVPGKELRRLVKEHEEQGELDHYKALFLAAWFGVSYGTLLVRLKHERLIQLEQYEEWKQYSPSAMAQQMGLNPEDFRIPQRKTLLLERYPFSIHKKVRQAITNGLITIDEAAELLDIETSTIESDLLGNLPKPTPEEEQEFLEFPG
ncbi:XRE family transcriptional regulator [Trichocoleus desertorum AS-A10]